MSLSNKRAERNQMVEKAVGALMDASKKHGFDELNKMSLVIAKETPLDQMENEMRREAVYMIGCGYGYQQILENMKASRNKWP